MKPLVPGESCTTELTFTVPSAAQQLNLLVRTVPGLPDHVIIGDENSWFHKKTYLAL